MSKATARWFRPALVAGVAATLASCQTTGGEPPPPPPDRTFTVEFPVVEPLPETEELLTLQGIRVSMAPRAFDVDEQPYCEYREIATSMRALLSLDVSLPPSGVTRETHAEFEEIRYMRPHLNRSGVDFLVTISNQMERVFRGSGSVFQFAVGGRQVASESINYQAFQNAIVTPGAETQVNVRGPELSSLSDDSTLAINIYDIVAAVDDAGNVTQRENAEWFFRVLRENREFTMPGERRSVWISHQRAQQFSEGSLVRCVAGVAS